MLDTGYWILDRTVRLTIRDVGAIVMANLDEPGLIGLFVSYSYSMRFIARVKNRKAGVGLLRATIVDNWCPRAEG